MGEALSETSIASLALNREELARLAGSVFCYSGAFLAPVQASLRIAFSQLSQLTDDWVTSCAAVDELLAASIRRMLTSLVDIGKRVEPFPRAIIPEGFKPVMIVISVDSSAVGLGFCAHLISQKGDVRVSHIFLGRPSVHRLTVPAGEYTALGKAVRALPVILESHKRLSNTPNMKLVFATDSLVSCMNLSPSKHHKDVRVRNTTITIYRILTELTNTHPSWSVSLTHVQGIKNPSDLLTKLAADPVKQVNSSLWRYGNDAWVSPGWPPKEAVFLEFKHGGLPMYTAPVAEQHRSTGSSPGVTFHPGNSAPINMDGGPDTTRSYTNWPHALMTSPEPSVCNLRDGLVPILSASLYNDLIHRFSSLKKVLVWLKNQYMSFYCWKCRALHKGSTCFCHVLPSQS